ncbi:MAG: BamA/TamA family outer membrane protein [Prevotella sp.]|nr:BamA/TamA family outer membrane protein [Prevotella sp.]
MVWLWCTASIATSCSITRYVPDGSYLLNSVKVKVDERSAASAPHSSDSAAQVAPPDFRLPVSDLKMYVRQQPNSRLFSLFRLPLATWSLAGPDNSRWLNRTLHSLGEPPVILDTLKTLQTQADLQQQLRNVGFLQGNVRVETHRKGRKADVTYWLQPGAAYTVRHLHYAIDDPQIAQRLAATDSTQRLLYEGMRFDVSSLEAERKRITTLLTNDGFFRFHKEYITFLADTIPGTQDIDLTLRLGLFQRRNQPDTLHTRYYMNRIDYASGDPADPQIHLRHRVLEECTHLAEGQPYSAALLRNTYNHFGRMQAVRYTNITFTEPNAISADSALLDCHIQLQSHKPSTLSFQPEGTNTAGDLGAAASLTYQNRNLFRGSEVMSLKVRGAYEAIRGLEGYSNQDFMEYSAEARLQFPRFIMPFVGHKQQQMANATSELSLLYDLQNRPEFHRRVLSAAWRYRWHSAQRHENYQFDLLDLDYVFMPWISATFKKDYLDSETTRNAILRYNYEDLFIAKIGFGYAYNHNGVALKTNFETSGNLLAMGARLFKADKDDLGHYRLFNIAFAQYVKGDIDITRSLRIDQNNQIVLHAAVGIAYPYGNSNVLPFEKRYFAGGANSVRGWSVRSLGPGRYKERDGRINFINQTGDMKLDLNAEYRTLLFWKLSGALFIDAGNVWTLRDYPGQPGGKFTFSDFPSQIAVGYGAGVRMNFGYFILRFDLGMKAVNPAYAEDDEEHYPILHPRFSRDYAFHFAVGMPF